MAAHQAPPSLGFSRQEQWSGLPFPSPMSKRAHSALKKPKLGLLDDALWVVLKERQLRTLISCLHACYGSVQDPIRLLVSSLQCAAGRGPTLQSRPLGWSPNTLAGSCQSPGPERPPFALDQLPSPSHGYFPSIQRDHPKPHQFQQTSSAGSNRTAVLLCPVHLDANIPPVIKPRPLLPS